MNVKLRKLREEKQISQEKMASLLDISQSQYCRKEANRVGFTEEEWSRMADLLDTEVENIRDEDAKVILQYNQGTITGIAHVVNVSEQLVSELKEHNTSLKEIIEMQKEFLKSKDEQIALLKSLLEKK